MLQYDTIDAPEVIDVNKITDWHDCIICYYRYFLKINFRFQPKIVMVVKICKKL